MNSEYKRPTLESGQTPTMQHAENTPSINLATATLEEMQARYDAKEFDPEEIKKINDPTYLVFIAESVIDKLRKWDQDDARFTKKGKLMGLRVLSAAVSRLKELNPSGQYDHFLGEYENQIQKYVNRPQSETRTQKYIDLLLSGLKKDINNAF